MGQWKPTNFRAVRFSEDSEKAGGASPGGSIVRGTAGQSLLIGDFVCRVPGINRWFKTLGSSYYGGSCQTGIVVGGKNTYYNVNFDSGAIGISVAAAAEDVLVMTRGICYAVCDATGIKSGYLLSAGRTTAGRVIGDMKIYGALTPPGLKKNAGTGLTAEAEFACTTLFAGGPGTALAAGVDMAALVGTVNNALYGCWEQRVASNGTTVTTAAGSITATTKAALTLPTGSAALITLGLLIVHPTGTGNFVGGTTALDDATVVPNAEYYDLIVDPGKPRMVAAADGGAAASAVLVELL